MRTTVDLPEALMARVRSCLAARNMTFRALVIQALERVLEEDSGPRPFVLRDASVGQPTNKPVSSDSINRVIDEQRDLGAMG